MLASLILLVVLDLNSPGEAQQLSCHFKKIDGVIHSAFLSKNVTSPSKLAALMDTCGCETRCALTHFSGSQSYSAAPLSALLITWLRPNITASAAVPSVSFVQESDGLALEKPSGLWMMDSVFGCRNLGAKGGALLDCVGSGANWNAPGPIAWSQARYSRLGNSSQLYIPNKHGGNVVLNFEQPFSMAVWVKTDDVSSWMPILDGRYQGGDAVHFWFYKTRNQDQLFIARDKFFKTTVNAENRLQWRHVAVVYKGNAAYDFYLNGNLWPSSLDSVINISGKPDVLQIGYRNTDYFFRGSMACIAIYERALTGKEIGTLMQKCP